jgi:hypothetical protein
VFIKKEIIQTRIQRFKGYQKKTKKTQAIRTWACIVYTLLSWHGLTNRDRHREGRYSLRHSSRRLRRGLCTNLRFAMVGTSYSFRPPAVAPCVLVRVVCAFVWEERARDGQRASVPCLGIKTLRRVLIRCVVWASWNKE